MQAWLNLTPEGATSSNRQAYGDVLPPVPAGYAHLVPMLHDLGTVSYQGMGLAPVSYTEIGYWAAQMGVQLSALEVRALHQMSAGFASISGNKNSACPTDHADVQASMNAANAAMWKAFASHG